MGFEERVANADPFSDEYWAEGIDYLLSYQSIGSLQHLIREKLLSVLDELEHDLDFIKRDGGDLDWNEVLVRYGVLTGWFGHNLENSKPICDLNAVLNIYLVINQREEELLDIVDPRERNDRFFKYLHAHEYDRSALPHERIHKYKSMAENLATETRGRAVSQYLNAQADLREIATAVQRCTADLDGWIQLQIDIARGK